MKIDSRFKLRKIAGETIIVNQGTVGADLTKIISLNETATFLFNEMSGKEFTVADVEKALKDTYEVDDATVAKDSAAWVDALKNSGVITE